MLPEATSGRPAPKAPLAPSSSPSLRSLTERKRPAPCAAPAESAKLERAIKANLKGLSYVG